MTAPIDTAGLVAELRNVLTDWNGADIPDAELPRIDVLCGTLRRAADEIERLSALESRAVALADANTKDTAKDSEMAEARAALEVCQRAIAMMISPDAIRQTSVANAFAAATEAEARARTVLSREKEAG